MKQLMVLIVMLAFLGGCAWQLQGSAMTPADTTPTCKMKEHHKHKHDKKPPACVKVEETK